MSLGKLFERLFVAPETAKQSPQQRQHLAAAVLLVEMAKADFETVQRELDEVAARLQAHFKLPADEAEALLEHAQQAHADNISLEPYISAMNESASREEKRELLEALWRVAFSDGELHRYEEHVLRRMSELLFMSHSDFIQTKLKVMGEA